MANASLNVLPNLSQPSQIAEGLVALSGALPYDFLAYGEIAMTSVEANTIQTTPSDEECRKFFRQNIPMLTDSLFRTARRITGDGTVAEDMVAEAIAKAWASRAKLSDWSAFKPWVFRILVNLCKTDLKKRGREITFDAQAEEQENNEDFWIFEKLHQPFLLWWNNPEQEFLNSIVRDDIKLALEGLPDKYKMAIGLVLIEECSYAEAADILSLPIGTIRSRVNRGRSLLQKTLWQHAQEAGVSKDTEEKPQEGKCYE